MPSKRRRVSVRSGWANTPAYYNDDLEEIELGHDPRTKPAEPELSPITEESRSGSASASSSNPPEASPVHGVEYPSDGKSPPDAQSPLGRKKRLPDTAYHALPPTNWVSETPFLVRDRNLGRGTSPETFAESLRLSQTQYAQEHTVEEQVHEEYKRYLMSANAFAQRWEESAQTPPWLATVEEELALQLAGCARPPSPRDYWEDSGPVRREHFDEYKARKEQNERNLAKLFFRAGRKIQDLQKEVRSKDEEIEAAEKVIVALQARAVELEALGIRDHKLAEHPDSRTRRRPPLEKVYRNDYSSRHERTRLADLPSTRKFLYDDAFSQNVELVVETALQRADLMWKLEDWDQMWAHGTYAHTWAQELQYKPLMQRCHFYLGVAAYGQGKYKDAVECFEWAAKCRNHYFEGELVGDWHIRASREVRRRKDPNFREADEEEDGTWPDRSDGSWSAVSESPEENSGYVEEEEEVRW
ncbi:hypothetical protein MMC18_008761 [Xylographa bjoerkii]|nr:hypothetical protein [Xylographa bjoerkii]